MGKVTEFNQDRMVAAAVRYAAADKSDPFALQRALCHIQSGVATLYTREGKDAFYDAEPYQEERITADGQPYLATVYKNIARP